MKMLSILQFCTFHCFSRVNRIVSKIMTSFSSPFSFQIPYCFSPLHSHEILVVAVVVVVHFSHALLLICEICSVRVCFWCFSAEESDNVLVKP